MKAFEYNGKTYEPKMTRAAARAAEEQGLKLTEIADKPLSMGPLLLFAALFGAHRLPLPQVEALFDDCLDAGVFTFDSVIGELSQEYVGLFGSGESAKNKK